MLRILRVFFLLAFRAIPVYMAVWVTLHILGPFLVLVGKTRHGRRLGYFILFADVCWLLLAGWFLAYSYFVTVEGEPPAWSRWVPFALVVPALLATLVAPNFLWPDYLAREWRKTTTGFVLGFFPESDLTRVVVRGIGWLDRRLDRDKVERMILRTEELLAGEKLSTAPNIPALGLPIAIEGLAGLNRLPGAINHGYVYDPVERSAGPKTGVLFLHGHGGNLQLALFNYDGFPHHVLLPSFSYGNWESPLSLDVIRRDMDYALRELKIAPERLFLAGISQGGAGVSRAAAAMPERFAGLIYYSPTMELSVIQSEAFRSGWKGKPVLVFTGGKDTNVPVRTVDAGVEAMQQAKVDVTYVRDPEEDHFYFFGQREFVLKKTADWMRHVGSRKKKTNS